MLLQIWRKKNNSRCILNVKKKIIIKNIINHFNYKNNSPELSYIQKNWMC